MGGTVVVDSNLGEGTTFSVELMTKAKIPKNEPAPSSPKKKDLVFEGKKT